MTKHELLALLDDAGQTDAYEVADAMDVSFAAASMALLRAVRAGLVRRTADPGTGICRYSLSPRGAERLAYLNDQP